MIYTHYRAALRCDALGRWVVHVIRAEIHDAGEFKQLDVDISFIRSYLSEKRLNGVSRQFGLDRMECDLRHIKEL